MKYTQVERNFFLKLNKEQTIFISSEINWTSNENFSSYVFILNIRMAHINLNMFVDCVDKH